MTTSTDSDIDLQVRQKRVDAASASPLSVNLPNSVFSLGDSITGATIDKTHLVVSADERILEHLGAAGPAKSSDIKKALRLSGSSMKKWLDALIGEGRVVRTGNTSGARYEAVQEPRAGGFKGWLERKGQASAEGRAKPTRKPLPATTPPAPARRSGRAMSKTKTVSAVVPVPSQALDPSDIECGLFTSGGISIECDGQVLKLNPQRTRKLLDWLFKVDAVLRPEDTL